MALYGCDSVSRLGAGGDREVMYDLLNELLLLLLVAGLVGSVGGEGLQGGCVTAQWEMQRSRTRRHWVGGAMMGWEPSRVTITCQSASNHARVVHAKAKVIGEIMVACSSASALRDLPWALPTASRMRYLCAPQTWTLGAASEPHGLRAAIWSPLHTHCRELTNDWHPQNLFGTL